MSEMNLSNEHRLTYYMHSLNKKEWIYSLFKEWILEKSEIRVNLEWTFVLFTHFGVTTGITQVFRVIPEVTPKWVNNTNVHSKFTLISLVSEIHSLKSEHIQSFEWIWSEHLCYSLILEWPQGSLRDSEWSLRSLQNEWITQMFTPNSLQIHSNFTLFWNLLLKEWTYSLFFV